ncbi:MAG: glycosyltransferase, partial [Candidatus Margulisiibacteriota bacterium]
IGTAGSTSLNKAVWCHLSSISYGDSTIPLQAFSTLPIPYFNFESAIGLTVDSFDKCVNADAIDMEAFHIANICHDRSIAFSSFKFITDNNNSKTNFDFEELLPVFHYQFNLLLEHLFILDFTVAVVIPVFNRSNQLTKALNSVLNQTYLPSEIIVVDDGSDPKVEISDDRINLQRVMTNTGVSNARNLGIRTSKSNWIAFLDSDDTWHKNHLQVMVNFIQQNPLCRFLQTNETWVRNGVHLNKKAYHKKPEGWAITPSLDRCLVSPSAVMLHRNLFDWFGVFDIHLTVCEDYDLWLRLLRYVPVGFVNINTMTKYGGHKDQLSMAYPAMDRFRVYSLIKLYNKEGFISFKKLYKTTLLIKLNILLNGAIKRGYHKKVSYYNLIINELNDDLPKLSLSKENNFLLN